MALDADFLALQLALAGQYSLERELGRGGMGIVYLAREVSLERLVAIKVLPPAYASRPELRERFLREARTAARLSHPNIVPIFRVGEAGDCVYFAMAYVDGETVGQRLRGRGPFPPAEAARILREAAWALAYAHAQGVVHRDVKPDNILLERSSGRALLTDFGIARVQETTSLTDEQAIMGTAHFMSPEQASGEPLDGRSDLYSLGIVGYLMLTGRLPFDAATVPAVLVKQLSEQAPPLLVAGAGRAIPPRLAQAIERCMAKSPAARPASGEALADALAASTQERRVLPAPLRVWLQKRDPLTPAYLVWSSVSLLGAYAMTLQSIYQPEVTRSGVVSRFLLASLLPLLPLAGYHLRHSWRVLRLGYTRGDLLQALRLHSEQQREESVLDVPTVPPWLDRLLRFSVYGSWTAFLALFSVGPLFLSMRHSLPFPNWVLGVPPLLTVVGSVLGVTFPARGLRPGRATELRLKFWESRPGRWLARLLEGSSEGRGAPEELVQRHTEVAIGLAVDQLFAALPRQLRAQLHELPNVVTQLEQHARTVRRRLDELDILLSSATPNDGDSRQLASATVADDVMAQRDSVSDDLRGARDLAQQRLAQTVAALETIRLDLLRLQGGVGDVGRLTTAIHGAQLLGIEVERLLAARDGAEKAIAADSPESGGVARA